MKAQFVIHIEPLAATKPVLGAPCNGCGVCCLSEPCPLGIVLSRRRQGPCQALRWDGAQRQYRCGALTDGPAVLRQTLPVWLRWLAPRLAPGLRRWGHRWIAVGHGCDCAWEVQAPDPGLQSDRQSVP